MGAFQGVGFRLWGLGCEKTQGLAFIPHPRSGVQDSSVLFWTEQAGGIPELTVCEVGSRFKGYIPP